MAMAPNTMTTAIMAERERIVDSIRCPVCRCICLPPVHQCFNGHIVCNACSRSLQAPFTCPTCRQTGPFGRCLVADHILAILNPVLPCGFNCGRTLPLDEHQRHRVSCEKRSLLCPNVECRSAFEDGNTLVTHFRLTHLYRAGDDERGRTSVPIFVTNEALPDTREQNWRLRNTRLFDTTLLSSFGQTFIAVAHSADSKGSKLRIWVGCANPAASNRFKFKFCVFCEGKRITLENTTDCMRVPRIEAEDVGLVIEATTLRDYQIGGRVFCLIAVEEIHEE